MTISDDQLLASLGYKQGQPDLPSSARSLIDDFCVEFKRAFTPLEVFGLGFSIIGLIPSIACVHISVRRLVVAEHEVSSSVLVFALPSGGASALVWGVCPVSCFRIP
jgi:hypothetical protein